MEVIRCPNPKCRRRILDDEGISIVAKSLAAKLMQIEKEVEAYEAAKAAHDRKMKKGWRR